MKSLSEHMYRDDIGATTYVGVVEDISDPLKQGRAKIRVFGKFGTQEQIPTAHLPWAYPEHGGFGGDGASAFSTPKVGAEVKVQFPDGNIYYPKYSTHEEISTSLLQELNSSYENSHSLLWDADEDVKVTYTQDQGLLIHNKGSQIQWLNDNSILISHEGKTAEIELNGNDIDMVSRGSINGSSPNNINLNSNNVHVNGVATDIGANPIFSSVNGEPLMILLKAMATIIDAKMAVTAGATVDLVNQFEQTILSRTVKTTP